jgi:hypothetical protein
MRGILRLALMVGVLAGATALGAGIAEAHYRPRGYGYYGTRYGYVHRPSWYYGYRPSWYYGYRPSWYYGYRPSWYYGPAPYRVYRYRYGGFGWGPRYWGWGGYGYGWPSYGFYGYPAYRWGFYPSPQF